MDELEQFKAAVRAEIDANGWHVVLVPESEDRPAYAFTIGLLERFQHPELCVVGLDDGEEGGLMHDLIDSAAEFIAEGGKLESGVRNSELFVGHSLGVRAVTTDNVTDWLALGVTLNGERAFIAVQLLWPDRRGRLPFEPSCEVKVVEFQPMLG